MPMTLTAVTRMGDAVEHVYRIRSRSDDAKRQG
jgi:hypothetical protein